jgi:hypothetical protein
VCIHHLVITNLSNSIHHGHVSDHTEFRKKGESFRNTRLKTRSVQVWRTTASPPLSCIHSPPRDSIIGNT